MIAGWREVALGDVAAEVTVGHVGPMASEYVDVGIPFLRSLNVRAHSVDLTDVRFITQGFHDRLKKSALRPGDVLTIRTGKPGTTAVVPSSIPVANCSDVVITRPGPDLDPRWISYYINGAAAGFVASRLVGAVQQHFNVSSAKEMRLDLPPLQEQRAIAATLGALDDKIESNRRATQLALELAEAEYANATKGRPTEFHSSTLHVSMGSAFKGAHFSDPGVGRPLLRIRDLKTFEAQVWTTESRADETVIRPGDVVVGMDAEFRAALWLGQDALLNQRTCTFRPKPPAGRAFALFALKPELTFQEQSKTGTTVIHLNKADIDKFKVPALSESEHAELAHRTEPLIDLVLSISVQNRTLTALRDALLPELLSGRIVVNPTRTEMP